jgi:N utilization substance protein B
MPVVDRCVLRLAVYELTFTDTPTAVVIDEAVELAKTYSTARSGRFVNGVLGAIADAAAATPGRDPAAPVINDAGTPDSDPAPQ